MSDESNEQREALATDVESKRVDRAIVVRKKDWLFRLETRILYLVSTGLAVWVFIVASEIQASRVENLRNACQRDSTENRTLVGFVVDSIAANPKYRRRLIHPEGALAHGPPYSANKELDDYIMRAVKTFPAFSDEECARRAREQVEAR